MFHTKTMRFSAALALALFVTWGVAPAPATETDCQACKTRDEAKAKIAAARTRLAEHPAKEPVLSTFDRLIQEAEDEKAKKEAEQKALKQREEERARRSKVADAKASELNSIIEKCAQIGGRLDAAKQRAANDRPVEQPVPQAPKSAELDKAERDVAQIEGEIQRLAPTLLLEELTVQDARQQVTDLRDDQITSPEIERLNKAVRNLENQIADAGRNAEKATSRQEGDTQLRLQADLEHKKDEAEKSRAQEVVRVRERIKEALTSLTEARQRRKDLAKTTAGQAPAPPAPRNQEAAADASSAQEIARLTSEFEKCTADARELRAALDTLRKADLETEELIKIPGVRRTEPDDYDRVINNLANRLNDLRAKKAEREQAHAAWQHEGEALASAVATAEAEAKGSERACAEAQHGKDEAIGKSRAAFQKGRADWDTKWKDAEAWKSCEGSRNQKLLDSKTYSVAQAVCARVMALKQQGEYLDDKRDALREKYHEAVARYNAGIEKLNAACVKRMAENAGGEAVGQELSAAAQSLAPFACFPDAQEVQAKLEQAAANLRKRTAGEGTPPTFGPPPPLCQFPAVATDQRSRDEEGARVRRSDRGGVPTPGGDRDTDIEALVAGAERENRDALGEERARQRERSASE
jgi:hypothetical protein